MSQMHFVFREWDRLSLILQQFLLLDLKERARNQGLSSGPASALNALALSSP